MACFTLHHQTKRSLKTKEKSGVVEKDFFVGFGSAGANPARQKSVVK